MKCFCAHESTSHHFNTLPRIHLRLPTEEPSSALTLILGLLVVSIYLSMNCIGNQVVLYRRRGYSNSFIPCRGVLRHTRSHHLPSLQGMYSATFKRKPNVGVGHDLPNHLSLQSRFIAYPGSIRRESGRGFHIRPRTMCAGFPVTKRATRYTGPRAYRITAHPLVSAVHGLQLTTNTRNYVQLLDRGQG